MATPAIKFLGFNASFPTVFTNCLGSVLLDIPAPLYKYDVTLTASNPSNSTCPMTLSSEKVYGELYSYLLANGSTDQNRPVYGSSILYLNSYISNPLPSLNSLSCNSCF